MSLCAMDNEKEPLTQNKKIIQNKKSSLQRLQQLCINHIVKNPTRCCQKVNLWFTSRRVEFGMQITIFIGCWVGLRLLLYWWDMVNIRCKNCS